MIWEKIKNIYDKSYAKEVYYNIKKIPVIRLFFDFSYATALWERGEIKNISEKALKRLCFPVSMSVSRGTRWLFIWLLSLCPILRLWGEKKWHIILLVGVLSIYVMAISKKEAIRFALFYEGILTAVFAPFIPVSVLLYVIYMEIGVLLFFIVRDLSVSFRNSLICLLAITWLLLGAISSGKDTAFLVAFLPYAICFFCKGKGKKYLWGTIILSMGVYALSNGSGAGLLGGGIATIVMIILGETWLLVPVIISAPWIVSLAIRVVKRGLFSKEIVKTGLFFWSQSFKGALPDTKNLDFGEYGNIISALITGASYIFFWYVLRVSRSAFLELFKGNEEKKALLRAGLGAIIGFSVYTFFSKIPTFYGDVIIYLYCGALLKGACLKK